MKQKKRKLQQFAMLATTFLFIIIICMLVANSDKSIILSSNIDDATRAIEDELSTSKNISTTNEKITENITTEETTTEIASTQEAATKINYKKLINFDAEYPYQIKVNRLQNWLVVYGMDQKGRYSIPYKIFVCSTGLHEGDTPLGSYSISDKYEWRLMVDGTYAQYATRIGGPIMLHSVPYYTPNKDNLEVEEYNKLGSPASLGCIRLNVKNIKWIYDNCKVGTSVIVYDSEVEEPPLALPKVKKAKLTGKKAGWDPTDPDERNPWKKK